MPTPSLRFATFWQGELSPFEAACITSYVRRGYDIAIYSYLPLSNVPKGVAQIDASQIVGREYINSFLYNGVPNLSHYSDYFRYMLFKKTDCIWVDADMLLVRRISEKLPATVLARERQPSICGAVMRIARNDDHLDNLIRRTEAARNRNLLWGETGPLLLTREFGKSAMLKQALPARRFYAIDHDRFWKVFLPEHADECEELTAESWGVHLWNNIVDTLGYWKRFAPPRGSFLFSCFHADGTIDLFDDVYPENIMRNMIVNWRMRKTGEDLGIRQLSTQVVPSLLRTYRHYRN